MASKKNLDQGIVVYCQTEESTEHMHKIELVIALEQEKAAFLLGRYCSVFQQLPCSYTALRALAIIRQTPAVQVETAAAAAAI